MCRSSLNDSRELPTPCQQGVQLESLTSETVEWWHHFLTCFLSYRPNRFRSSPRHLSNDNSSQRLYRTLDLVRVMSKKQLLSCTRCRPCQFVATRESLELRVLWKTMLKMSPRIRVTASKLGYILVVRLCRLDLVVFGRNAGFQKPTYRCTDSHLFTF